MVASDDTGSGNATVGRIRPDDELIARPVVQRLMGGLSTSAIYEDADLMALKIDVTAGGQRTRVVRWIAREIHELRAQRVARSGARAAQARAQVDARRERRRAK